MTFPFLYPPAPHVRRHGPVGYADRASFRPWLRDEFAFRCVYCLLREQWGRVHGVFDIDHFLAVVDHPDLAVDYDNLLYACTTCNLAKRDLAIPDPLIVLSSITVQISEDGRLHTENAESACLVEILGLNADDAVEFRMTWIGIVALAAHFSPELHRKLMGLPDDLPDLRQARPPGGNTRREGVNVSWFARRERGELPETY